MTRRYAVLAVSLIMCVGFTAFVDLPALIAGHAPSLAAAEDSRPSQVKFSHKMHIKDVGADCATCHPEGSTSKLSSDNLASTHDQCSSCHEDQVTNDCGFCHTTPDNIVARPAASIQYRACAQVRDADEDFEAGILLQPTDPAHSMDGVIIGAQRLVYRRNLLCGGLHSGNPFALSND